MLRTLLIGLVLLLLGGCGSDRYSGNRHLMREVRLTPSEPWDKLLGIRLVRVDPDGAAVIAVEETLETLRAMPGEPFLGRYQEVRGYRVRTFGEHGLILASSDVGAKSAVLRQIWAEPIRDWP